MMYLIYRTKIEKEYLMSKKNMPQPGEKISVSFWKGETYFTVTGSVDDQGWWSNDSEIHADGSISELLDTYSHGWDIRSSLLDSAMTELMKKEGE